MKLIYRIWKSRINIPRRAFWVFARKIQQYFDLFTVTIEKQNASFEAVGLNRKFGERKLNEILIDNFGKKYDENDGMFSEHLILIASLSAFKNQIKSILEIGTFDGRTALILSKLFSESKIITIDLPSKDEVFEKSYNRNSKVSDFVYNRNKNISKSNNVEFRETNSLSLANYDKEKFDLIWIDGAHGYPIVAMDIINSYRLGNSGAFILIDDIWKEVNSSDKMYKSIGGYESLKSLHEAKLINNYSLFYKRLNGSFNFPNEKKYVGFFQKP